MSLAPVHVPQSPMSLGDVFTATFSVFRRRLGTFVALAALQQLVMAVVLVAPVVLSLLVLVPDIVQNTEPDSGTVLVFVLTGAGSFVVALALGGIVSLLFTGMMIGCANEATQQRFPSWRQLRALTKGFVGRYVGLYLLGVLAYVAAAAVVFAPLMAGLVHLASVAYTGRRAVLDDAVAGLLASLALTLLLGLVVMALAFVLGVKLAYLSQVCAVERLSGFRALGRAWLLTRGSFWRTFGYLFVFSLLAGAAQQAVSFVLSAVRGYAMPMVSRGSSGSELLDALQGSSMWMMLAAVYAVTLVVALVLVPLRAIFVTVMYGDQFRRERLGPVDHAFAVTAGYAYRPGGQPGQPGPHGQPGYGGQGAPGAYGRPTYGPQPAPYPQGPYQQGPYQQVQGPYPQGPYPPAQGPYERQPGPYGRQPGAYGEHGGPHLQDPGPPGPQSPHGQG